MALSFKIRLSIVLVLLRVISLTLLILGIWHTGVAIVSTLKSNFKTWQDITIYFQIFLEILVFFQTSAMIFTISNSIFTDGTQLTVTPILNYPDLDIFIPTRRVDPSVLKKTLSGLREQDYPQDRLHIFIADDTPEDDLFQQYEDLSKEFNVTLIREPSNIKYKAGMLNIAIPLGKSDYIAFFDFDQIPTKGILRHFVEVLEHNDDYAFVQAKKTFKDLYNLSRVWSALLYVQFFEVIEKSKSKLNTVMFAGSTACFRRSAIELAGGIPEDTFTEDNSLTLQLIVQNTYGLFTDRIGSIGTVPYGFPAQISQLWRWSHGGTHVLRNRWFSIIKSKNLSVSQKIDVLSTFSITPILVLIYLYSASFILLLLNNVDSPRLELFGISSLIFIPLAPALTYILMAMTAVWSGKKNSYSEFEYHHIFGFLLIALASNILILTAGIAGFFGLYGPNSNKGEWNRKIKIWRIAIFGFIIGFILEVFAISYLVNGYTSSIILVLISLTLLPTLPIVWYYSSHSRF